MGEWIALVSGCCFAYANVAISRGAREYDADNGVFLSLILTTAIAGLAWLALGAWRGFGPVSAKALAWFVGAGALTAFLGRVLLYASVQRLGAVRAAALRRLTPLFAVALGIGVMGDPVSALMALGMALIVWSFLILLRLGFREARAAHGGAWSAGVRRLNPGYLYAPISALGYAAGALLRKLGLNETPDALLGTVVGALVGLALFFAVGAVQKSYRAAIAATFARYNAWLLAAGVASSFGQILSLVALSYTTVSRVAVVTSLEVYITMVIARLMLGGADRDPASVLFAATLGVAGTVLVALY